MKKTLAHLRSKSPEVRMTIAFTLALVFTLIIGAGWVMTLSSGGHEQQKSKAPSPFNSLTGAIKDVVITPNKNTEIIDAGNTDPLHDESNPYQQ
jgi:hypothetical protein